MVRKKTDNSKREESGFKFRYVFYIIVMLLLLLSIFSHAPEDFAVIQGGSDEPVKNWIGPVGAQISCLLFLLFGVTVYPLIIILVVCALRPFLDFPTKRRGYFGAFIAVVIGATILFAMWPGDFAYRTAKLGIGRADAPLSALSGGVVGQVLASPKSGEIPAGFIRRYIGSVGTVITALVFVLSGAFFLWLADWKVVCVHLLNRNNGASKQTKSKTSVKVEPEEDEEEGEKKSGLWPFGKNKKDDQEEEIDEEDEEEEEEELPPVIALKPKRTEPMFDEEEEPAPPVSKIPKQSSQQKSYENSEYVLPPVTMLEKAPEGKGESDDAIQRSQEILQNTLESFSVDGKVSGIVTGPRVTRYEISLAPGVKVQKVEGIASNIAMELEAESIRILAPIPGKNAVGVEAPNSVASPVYLRAMMESSQWKKSNAEIPIVLGKDVSGKVVILDLAKAPHLLIAGATGSGKSVCMNTLIMSLLFRFAPSELRVIMVDPKVVEMEMYTPLPHLITPVVNDPHKVPLALRWAVNEMENRYRVLAKAKCRNLAGFNARTIPSEPQMDHDGKPIPEKMPILVIIIDELADVMMTDAKSDVETSVARIAQKGRAAGIHIVIATQRPSTNIITGVIKANLPTRIAFRVGSIVDSRVILDQKGAESLLGRGDMLFVPPGSSNMERIQGAMVSDEDIEKIVEFSSAQAEQMFNDSVTNEENESDSESGAFDDGDIGDIDEGIDGSILENPMIAKYLKPDDGELIIKSMEILFRERKISTSYIQRRLKIGYNRAAEIVDLFEERGIIGPVPPGGGKRDILVFDELEEN